MNQIKVRKAQVKPLIKKTFPEYKGRTFKAEFTSKVTFYDTNWGGGTRNQYKAVRMGDGAVSALPVRSPWNNPVEGATIQLEPGIVIVKHTIFCGHDLGLTFYAHPSMSRLLEA